MSEHDREQASRTGDEDPAERAGGHGQSKEVGDGGCESDPGLRPDEASRGHVGETLAGDSTKFGKP